MATSPIYKTSNEAGSEVRRKGQGISDKRYKPGDFADQEFNSRYAPGSLASSELGRDYAPGAFADQALSEGLPKSTRRSAIANPASEVSSSKKKLSDLEQYNLEFGIKESPTPTPAQGSLEGDFWGDSGIALKTGAKQLIAGSYELGNLLTGGAIDEAILERTGQTGTQYWKESIKEGREGESAALKAQRKELEDAKGFWNSFSSVITNPRLAGSMFVEMAPQLISIAGAARATAVKTIAWGLEAGLSAEAATAAAATNATRTVLGLNAVLEGSMAGSDARGNIQNMKEEDLLKSPQYQKLLQELGSPQLARLKLANDASMVSTALAGAISLVAGKVTGAGKLEAQVMGGVVAATENAVKKSVAREVATGVARETAEETLQEGGAQFSTNVGERVSGAVPDKNLLEGVPESAAAGGAMGMLSGAGFGGSKAAFSKASDAIKGNTATDTSQAPPPPPPPPGGRDFRTNLSATEMSSAANSPAFMAHLWSQGDEQTRAALQAANPNLDLPALAADVDLVAQGNRIAQTAPNFAPAFLSQLEGFDLEVANQEAANINRVAGAPSMQGVKDLSNVGMQDAEAGVTSTKPPVDTTGNAGPAITTPQNPAEMPLLLQGYQRRARNMSSLPDNYRRDQATAAVEEMVNRGFTEEEAQAVFGQYTGQTLEEVLQQQNETAPETAPEIISEVAPEVAAEVDVTPDVNAVSDVAADVDNTKRSGFVTVKRTGPMSDDEFIGRISAWDNTSKGPGTSTPADYQIMPTPAPLQRLADAFGVQVKIWDYKGGGSVGRRQGVSLGRGVIGINGGRTSKNNSFVIFGHELFHELAKRDRAKADQLIAAMQDYLDANKVSALKEKLREVGYAEGKVNEEIVADILGVLFTESGFWQQMAEKQPTLLESIIDIVRQMIARLEALGYRESVAKDTITNLDAVEKMMSTFLNDAINKQSAGTSIEDNIQLNATQAESLKNVRSLLAKGQRTEAAAAFKAANLWKETGLNFNELVANEDAVRQVEAERAAINAAREQPVVERPPATTPVVERETADEETITFRRPQEEIDSENAYAAMTQVIELLRANRTADAAKVFRESNLAEFGENFKNLQQEVVGDLKKKTNEVKFATEEQKKLALKSKRSQFDKAVSSILSGMTNKIKEKTSQRKGLSKAKAISRREASDEQRALQTIGQEEGRGMLADDTGGVITQMAEAGMYGGAAGQQEANIKRMTAEEAKAEELRLAEENAAIQSGRVRQLLFSADTGLAKLAKIRQDMASAGYSGTEIEATVGKAESDLKSVRDGELRDLAEQQLSDTRSTIVEPKVSKVEPIEYTGQTEIQNELDFNDGQRTDARRIVAAISTKSENVKITEMLKERVAALKLEQKNLPRGKDAKRNQEIAAQISEINSQLEREASGKMTLDEAMQQARQNKIGQMHMFDAMREAGIEIPTRFIDISGNIAVNHNLNDWVKKFPNAVMAARDAWFRAYDGLPIKSVASLTDGEQVSYRNWKKNITEMRSRLKEVGTEFNSLETAFPNALPMNYTLNEMRNPDRIPEGDRRQMIKMEFDDPVRAWLKDLQFIAQARPDLSAQFSQFLTKEEQAAYKEFREREDSEARRAVDMKAKSALYSQVDGLRYLSPKVYTDFRDQISRAEENQLAAIMQAAFEANELSKDLIASGRSIETIGDLMDARANEDEKYSIPADEMSSEAKYDDDGDYAPDDSVRFKRGTHSGVLPALNVIEHLTRIFQNWKNTPAHTVVQNPNQLPDDVRARLASRFGATGFKGALDPKTGHIYLFSDFLESVEDAEFTMFHELYGHWGVRAFLGDSMNGFLENQYRLNQKVKEAADKQMQEGKDMGMPMTKLEAIEEAISDMAANGDIGLFHRIIGKLSAWLRNNGFKNIASWMDSSSNGELASVLHAARIAAKTQGVSPLSGAPSDVMYNRAKDQPVEAYAYRNGQITAFARINPITGDWTVFTINPGAESITEGNYNITTTDNLQTAHDLMKQHGTVRVAKARETLQYIGPENVVKVKAWEDDQRSWSRFKRWFIQGAQNKFLPIFEVAQQLNMAGKVNTVVDDLIKYESRTQYYIQDYQRRYLNPIMKGLKRLGDLGAVIEDVDLFLMARHAEERNGAIKSINPKNSRGSGMDSKEASKILSGNNGGKWDGKVRTELEMIGKLMDQLSKDKLNYLLQTGMISKFQFESLSRYKHYVNLSGNAETDLDKYDGSQLGGRAFNVRGSDVMRSTGRGTVAVDVLENTMNAYLSSVVRGQKNRPLQAILDMFEQNPDKTYVEVNPVETVKRVNVDKLNFDKKILRALGTDQATEGAGKSFLVGLKQRMERGEIDSDDAMAEVMQRIRLAEERRDIEPEEAVRAMKQINEQVVVEARLSPDGYVSTVESNSRNPNEVTVKVNGKSVSMVFKGRGLPFFESITGMNIQKSGFLIEAVSKWATFFSQIVTTWNPAWIPINAMRDVQTAISNMSADPEVGAILSRKMLKEYPRSSWTAFRYMLSDWSGVKDGKFRTWVEKIQAKHPLDPDEKKLMNEFYEDGSGTFFLDRDGLEVSLEKMRKAMNKDKGAWGWTKDKFEMYTTAMELASMPIEVAPRFAVYKVLREAGKSREFASRYAKELTVNFNMKGSSKGLRAAYVFFNPAVQGTVRLFKDLKQGNFGRFGTTAAFWMGLGYLSTMMARTFGGDDDDKPGVDSLDMVADYKRNTSLTWMPGVVGGSIPVAYGWNVFSSAGQYSYDVIHGKMPADKAALKMLNAAFDAFSPIGSGAESKSLLGTVAKGVTPSIALPVTEYVMNENRFGAPIYKEQSPFSDIKEANAYMHFNSVNPISKSLMQSFAAVGTNKNPRYTPGLVDVNPGAVDHFINSYLPGIISEAYKTAGLAIKKGRGEDTKDYAVPLLDRFKAKAEEDAFNKGAVRKVKEQVDTLWKSWQSPETGAAERAALIKEYPKLPALKDVLRATEQQIKTDRQALAALERDPRITDEYKVRMRNESMDREKEYNKRVVKLALQSGFRDTLIYGD